MSEFSSNRLWQFVLLGCGALLVGLALVLPVLIEPDAQMRMAKLEIDGVQARATITSIEVSPVQEPRHSTAGTYLAIRGLGGSRRAAAGTALIARSSARSSERARAAGPAYHDVEYEFPWVDGQIVTGAERVMLPRSNTLDVGSQLALLHDARDPGVHRLPNYSKPTEYVSFGLKYGPSALSLFVGVVLLWLAVQQMAEGGTPTAAARTNGRYEPQERFAQEAAPTTRRPRMAVQGDGFANVPAGRKGFGPRVSA
jgi:hypothetical protein